MIRRHIFYYHYFVPEEKPLLDKVMRKRVFSNVTYLIQTRLAIFYYLSDMQLNTMISLSIQCIYIKIIIRIDI